jgi:purine-binding chemotaxis protein CheW
MSTALPAPAVAAGKYLTIALDREIYGIPVLKVREIIRLPKITPVPQMPAHVRGVINLRGRVVAIVDLRAKFGLAAECAERTCIVVVQVRTGGEPAVPMGLIVNSVDEVVALAAGDIEPTPDFGPAVDTRCFVGMAKVKNRVMTLLDIDRVIGTEAAQLGSAA